MVKSSDLGENGYALPAPCSSGRLESASGDASQVAPAFWADVDAEYP